jgi:GNAT superfamily N-acetyltransferase
MYTFKLYDSEQLVELMHMHAPKYNEDTHSFASWEYFNFSDNANFLIALNGDESSDNIVGVIKFGLYFAGDVDQHYGLNYIDVRDDYQHKGIGSLLLKKFNTLFHDDIPVWCSFFSDYCIETKFDNVIEKSLSNYDVVYDHKYIIRKGTIEHIKL